MAMDAPIDRGIEFLLSGNENNNQRFIYQYVNALRDKVAELEAGGSGVLSSTDNGTDYVTLLANPRDTAGHDAILSATVGGTSAGDPILRLGVTGGSSWDLAVDNATSDRLEVRVSTLIPLHIDSATGYARFSDGNAPSDGNASFYVRQATGPAYFSIEKIESDTAGAQNFRILNNSTQTLGLSVQGTSTSGTYLTLNNGGAGRIIYGGSGGGLQVSTGAATPMAFGTNDTLRFMIAANGDLVPGTGAKGTTDTTGHMYIPSSAGPPTGVPTGYTGRIAFQYDTTNDRLYAYNGAWRMVAVA